MTDPITMTLEARANISRADSWPTGTNNDGPEQYGINYDPEFISQNTILGMLEDALIDTNGPGLYLDVENPNDDYDLGVTVHQHPLSRVLDDFFVTHETVTAYGLDWMPEHVWACYDSSPRLNLVAPGPLDAWFEAEDMDYDTVLDDIEDTIPEWERATDAHSSLHIHGADSDHCHIRLA